MPDNISLLPEELRTKEDQVKKEVVQQTASPSELRFNVPSEDNADDVEVIEIDEGDVDQVIAGQPPLTKAMYRMGEFFSGLKHRLLQPGKPVPAPKLPPQFFTAKDTSSVISVSAPTQAAATPSPAGAPQKAVKSGVSIAPFQKVPRRVRVITRIRKPVRVSFVSDDDLRLMRVDIPKRRFTLILVAIFFSILIGGGAYALSIQENAAKAELAKADTQLSDVRRQIKDKQESWLSFQDLEPQLKALGSLLDQHISPNKLFDEIERTTLPTVYYQSMNLTPDRRVVLVTIADSFQSAAEQVAAFQAAPFITSVEASGYGVKYETPASLSPSRVEFQLQLRLSDSALIGSVPVTSASAN
ncbi:hypothetical protein KBC54_04840 [Patescibacteria group bacterium]|nr:hypothetical protein [Patescibacteria group bacterium]